MEEDTELWQQVFQELIQEVKPWHKWTLTQDKDLLPDVLKPGWMQYQQKTFARFHCSSCSRRWASGCVLTVFHMHWCEKKGKGQVKMRVFAQRCNKCPEPPFAAPEFTWDNISRILTNLLFRILKKCYGEGFKQMDEIPLLRDTSHEGPHDSNNCEACLQGFCAQNGLGLASKPPAPPLSPASCKSTRKPKVTASCGNTPHSQTSSKVEKPQASKVDPKANNPTKADLKVSHTSNPSTTILTIQQVSPVSSPTPRRVTQMPSPIKSSRAADAENKNIRSKTQKALPTSSSFAPPTSSSFAPPTSSSFAPPTSSSFAPPTSSSFAPPTSSSFAPPTSSSFAPPTSSSFAPPTSSSFAPPTPSSFAPSTSSSFAPSTSSSFAPPTPSSFAPPTSSSFVPPTSSSFAPPTSSSLFAPPTSSFAPSTSSSLFAPPTPSSFAPPTPSYVVPNSWRPPANTTCQVERSSHIHPPSGACCEACCEACCKCFCEWGSTCCKDFCNCTSHTARQRLVFLFFVAIIVILCIKYGI